MVAVRGVGDQPDPEHPSSPVYPDGEYDRRVWVPCRIAGYWFCTEGGKHWPRKLIGNIIFELVLDDAVSARAVADHRLPA